jgi:hypothetical protein
MLYKSLKALLSIPLSFSEYNYKIMNLILMDPCIVDYSLEIPTRCSFVIAIIIPKFLKAQHVSSGTLFIIRSSKLYLQPLHSVLTQPWQRPVTIRAYKPEAANTVWSF